MKGLAKNYFLPFLDKLKQEKTVFLYKNEKKEWDKMWFFYGCWPARGPGAGPDEGYPCTPLGQPTAHKIPYIRTDIETEKNTKKGLKFYKRILKKEKWAN